MLVLSDLGRILICQWWALLLVVVIGMVPTYSVSKTTCQDGQACDGISTAGSSALSLGS